MFYFTYIHSYIIYRGRELNTLENKNKICFSRNNQEPPTTPTDKIKKKHTHTIIHVITCAFVFLEGADKTNGAHAKHTHYSTNDHGLQ